MNLNQTQASDPSKSVWVAASAGTGKTKILVDRILRLLLSGADISKILCITYTKAASLEMKERLMQVLLYWSEASSEELAVELAKIFAGEKDIDSSFFRKYRKNKSFSIKPHKINKNLHGKINVQIRSGIDLEPKNTVDFVFLMIQNENEVGYEQLFDFIKEVFYYIIRYNEDIFTAVYGRKIKCNFYQYVHELCLRKYCLFIIGCIIG